MVDDGRLNPTHNHPPPQPPNPPQPPAANHGLLPWLIQWPARPWLSWRSTSSLTPMPDTVSATWPRVDLHNLLVERTGHRPFSNDTRTTCWHEAMCEGRCHFVNAPGFYCGVERDTQRQLWTYMPRTAIVLEVGGRYGTVSCTISRRQQQSGLRVTVEPDAHALAHYLKPNIAANKCAGREVWGVVDRHNGSLPQGGSYGTYAHPSKRGEIPALSVSRLERMLPRQPAARAAVSLAESVERPRFSVLILDCEGCAFRFISEQRRFLRSRSLHQVYLEADGRAAGAAWLEYETVLIPAMCELGFDILEYAPNLTGNLKHLDDFPIAHMVFQRGGKCASPHLASQRQPSKALSVRLGLEEHHHAAAHSEASTSLRVFRDVILNMHYNPHAGLVDGASWPPGSRALSMAGQRRIDHVVALLATAEADGVPGHFIETGVWRGGMSFVAARALELLEQQEPTHEEVGPRSWPRRRVFMCDSFVGIPEQSAYGRGRGHVRSSAGAEQDGRAHQLSILNANSAERVRMDASMLGLDLSRLTFVIGFFNASLPKLLTDEPQLRFAIVRLDGDTYWSTYEALEALYPILSPGGFVIIDDYV